MKAVLAALVASVSAASAANKVACVGDSWAAFACNTLETVLELNLHFNQVENKGVAGMTANFYANNQALFLDLLVSADASYVWLSIGGDDLLGYYASKTGNSSYINSLVYQDMDTLLKIMTTVNPNVQIVTLGYDFVNFVQSVECIAMGALYFPGFNTTQINEAFLSYGHDVLAPLAQKYEQLTFDFGWGTLQAAGGPLLTPAPYPNVDWPSPAELMNDGCIHASPTGWTILMNKLYKDWFASRIQP